MNISSSGNYIVNTNGNGAVVIWDTREEKKIKQIQIGASAVSITADDKYLLIASQRPESYGIIVYNLLTDHQEMLLNINYSITSINTSHNGQYFATGGWYEVTDFGENYGKKYDQVILWDANTFNPIDTIETIEGEGSGYNIIKFSNDDKYLGCVRAAPYDERIYNIISEELMLSISDPIRLYTNIEFLPDNNYFLLSWGTFSNQGGLELHNFTSKINDYSIPVGNIDSYNSNGLWKIFCGAGMYPMTLLTNQIVGVEEQKFHMADIKITQVNNMIILETSNLNQTEINVEIYNLKGDIVHSELIENKSPDSSYKIDTLLPSGFYLCKVMGGSQVFSQKIEIVR
ncbi:T9SS C-terminal target domain-containing protein [Bacteroidetes/Chlorobi group bacterium ChocPot_Mid]|jgi:WD40 repeat protein|nr:MAG: T9SS C-terminal target domain-containing protein [Bacteroidetes/Chlorobi group bacterium ChocPot_Mid]